MIKRWLQKLPRLYGVLHRSYYATLYWVERHVLGTRLHELIWRARRLEDATQRSKEHPHRAFLMARIGRFAPLTSVLEVGCNTGPNLIALSRAYPGVGLYGLDINPQAIRAGQAALAEERIPNASMFVGRADDLSRFGDHTIDVVLTDATLMYVGPDKIARTIAELLRVARRGLLLNEWHMFEPTPDRAHWYYAHWVHDYQALLAGAPRVRSVQVERLPDGFWAGGGWAAYGAIIAVDL